MMNNSGYDISRSVSLQEAITGTSQSRLDSFVRSDGSYEVSEDEIVTVGQIPTEDINRINRITFDDSVGDRVTEFTHGIHTYPAKFIPQIPRWAFRYAGLEQGDTVYDPFVGCGTTMVEARLCGLNSFGADISPLARLMTRVKSEPVYRTNPSRVQDISRKFLNNIRQDDSEEELNLESNPYFSPMINWDFWFPDETLKQLIKIKRHIHNIDQSVDANPGALVQLKRLYRITLSSVIIPASYQRESQIKVYKNEDKFEDGLPDIVDLYSRKLDSNLRGLMQFAESCGHDELFAEIVGTDAKQKNVPNNSVDLVVTSPPYINAIDYTMAHRRSLIFLDFFDQQGFREHRREYIGMTERAVTKELYNDQQQTGYGNIDDKIGLIFNKGERKDKIRAFILYQYFTGMERAFEQLKDAIRQDGYCIIIVGDNEIRNEKIPTADYLVSVGTRVGFDFIDSVEHHYKKVQLQSGRNETGGKINYESILIFRNS